VGTFNAEMLDVYAVLAVGCSLAPILVRVKCLQQSAATSVLQTMSSTQQWVTLHWRMQIRPSAIMPCLRLQCG